VPRDYVALRAGDPAAAAGERDRVAAALQSAFREGSIVTGFDPALVTGKIIECDRGIIPRVDKSAEVKRAGGIGMVLVNLTPLDTDADLHTVPTVHLDSTGGVPAKAYAATAGATATLVPGNTSGIDTPYPQVAGFSSRGPSLSSNGDILKPDIAAPGVGILASVSPTLDNGRNFDFLSGTSMAAPHIAGLAALYVQRHPVADGNQVGADDDGRRHQERGRHQEHRSVRPGCRRGQPVCHVQPGAGVQRR